MLPERTADPIQRDGIRAGVEVAQAEAHDPEVVPELVVRFLGVRVEVEEQHEHVVRKKADGEH